MLFYNTNPDIWRKEVACYVTENKEAPKQGIEFEKDSDVFNLLYRAIIIVIIAYSIKVMFFQDLNIS